MSERLVFSLIMLFSVFVSACSQIILKRSATKEWTSSWRQYLNAPVLLSYAIFFCSTLASIMCLRYIPLSFSPVIESCGYVFVTLLGVFFLKEKISKRKLIGMLCIIVGIILFSL